MPLVSELGVNFMLQTPYGTNDFMPVETAAKRELENRFMNIFKNAGYDEVVTPTMEYLETLTVNRAVEDDLFKMFDLNNKTLALRHEMTTPIARLVQSRFKDYPLPIKLSYNANVFRFRRNQPGRHCEFYQAGIELLGANSTVADAETIALAAQCLNAANVPDFKICIGQVQFANGLIQSLPVNVQNDIKLALENLNSVALDEMDIDDKIKQIPNLIGDKNILDTALEIADNQISVDAVNNLKEIYNLLESYGVSDFVTFDLSLIRDFDYYNGMVFEVYAPNVGYSLAGGGRYTLADMPCSGFALGVERILLARLNQNIDNNFLNKDVYLAYSDGLIDKAVKKTLELRSQGKVVELATSSMSFDVAKKSQIAKGFTDLIYLER